MLSWLLLLWGCRGGPDTPPEPASWFELRIGDRRVGSAWSGERTVEGVRHAWGGQSYRWALDGREVAIEIRARAVLDPAGQVVSFDRWRDGEHSRWSGGPAWWLDQAAWGGILPIGTVQALDPVGLVVETVLVEGEPGHWSWTQGGVHTTVTADRQQWGVFELVPVSLRPELVAVDPVALLRRRSERIAGARGAHWASWKLGDQTRVVQTPLDLEIPQQTLRDLERLVRVVQRRLDHTATPGTPDALAALQSGRGDCNEFAEVFLALAHENGIAGRPVSGLVYTEGALGPGLDLHAWAEVDLGPPMGWVAVDPALGQPLADAAHLRLGIGPEVAASVVVVASPAEIALVAVR